MQLNFELLEGRVARGETRFLERSANFLLLSSMAFLASIVGTFRIGDIRLSLRSLGVLPYYLC